MGYFKEAYWQSEGQGVTRAERKSGRYHYFVPSKLNTLRVQIDSDVVADIVAAEKSLQAMNEYKGRLYDIDGLARFLLRASSQPTRRWTTSMNGYPFLQAHVYAPAMR